MPRSATWNKVQPDPIAGIPGDLPDPPTDLPERSLPLVDITGPWFRSTRPGRAVVHFGRSGEGRFDDPARRFGVLYLALSPHAAFIETLGGRAAVTPAELAGRVMSAAFHDHPSRPDGVLYRSRRDPSQLALALYEQEDWALEVTPLPPSTMASLADHYRLLVR